MKKFSVKLKIFKYFRLRYVEEEIFEAIDRADAKRIAKDFTVSTRWTMDLTPIPDLRTLKEVCEHKICEHKICEGSGKFKTDIF